MDDPRNILPPLSSYKIFPPDVDPEEQNSRKSWSHQFQGTSYGDAVDRAVKYWRTKFRFSYYTNPDEVVAVGPFSPQMRPDRVEVLDNMNGVWDITIRWY